MLISVIVPVFNEEGTVAEILRRVRATGLPLDVIVVDDASTDRSFHVAAGLRGEDLRILRHGRNRGKGAAVRTGLSAARGDILLIQDADLEYDPADFRKLVAPLLAGRADVVFGSRFMGRRPPGPLLHYLGNRVLTLVANRICGLALTDMETCYKAFTRRVADNLRLTADGFGIDPEFTAKVARMGCRIVEVPASYRGRKRSEGKKIRMKDGLVVLAALLRHRLRGRVAPLPPPGGDAAAERRKPLPREGEASQDPEEGRSILEASEP